MDPDSMDWKGLARLCLFLAYLILHGFVIGIAMALVQLSPKEMGDPKHWLQSLLLGVVVTVVQEAGGTFLAKVKKSDGKPPADA